jgi:hypothetical protein
VGRSDQLPLDMTLLAAGQEVDYHHAIGSYGIDNAAEMPQTRGPVGQIAGSELAAIDHLQCSPAEVKSDAYH